MKQLAKLQHTFQDCIINPGKPVSLSWVSVSGRAKPEAQLSIYTHAYQARLKEVLTNDYPAMLMAIGEDHFNQLADDYIEAHPSQYFSLRDFGRHLPDFVSSLIQQDVHYHNMPWLYELGVFEWTLGLAFDAADATLLSEEYISTVPVKDWPELTFVTHPSVYRLNFAWNIPEIWQVLTDNSSIQDIALREAASAWLIWREQLMTRFRSMEHDEQQALNQLCNGANFNQICETLATMMNEEEVPMHAASQLKSWIAQGLISGIQYD